MVTWLVFWLSGTYKEKQSLTNVIGFFLSSVFMLLIQIKLKLKRKFKRCKTTLNKRDGKLDQKKSKFKSETHKSRVFRWKAQILVFNHAIVPKYCSIFNMFNILKTSYKECSNLPYFCTKKN